MVSLELSDLNHSYILSFNELPFFQDKILPIIFQLRLTEYHFEYL